MPVDYETQAYDDLEEIKKSLQFTSEDEDRDARLNDIRARVSAAIDSYCRRTFVVGTPETRQFVGSRSPILWVGDLLSVTAVTVDGTALSASGYEAWPLNVPAEQPHYDRLIRKAGSLETEWSAGDPVRVAVTGTWGYQAETPQEIHQVCRIMTVRMWKRETTQYDNKAGVNQAGMSVVQEPIPTLDPDCRMLLKPFVKKWHFTNQPR